MMALFTIVDPSGNSRKTFAVSLPKAITDTLTEDAFRDILIKSFPAYSPMDFYVSELETAA